MRHRNQRKSTKANQPAPASMPVSLLIDRLSHDGRGIGYHQGKITFVSGALPGETHQVRVTEAKRNFLAGYSLSLIDQKAPDRVDPPCSLYGKCGGCQLQHLAIGSQRVHKTRVLHDQLIRAGVSLDEVDCRPIAVTDAWAYRRKARLSVNPKGRVFAGFRAQGGTELIPVNDCPVLLPELNALLPQLQQLLSGFRARVIGHVEIIEQQPKPVCLVRLVAKPNQQERESLQAFDAARLVFQMPDSREIVELDTSPLVGGDEFTLETNGRSIGFSLEDFVQVNGAINNLLVQEAINLARPAANEQWLDLFCGVGNFTFALASREAEVVGVEVVENMVHQARQNAIRLGAENCQFIAVDLQDESALNKLPDRVNGILLDPPRAGAREVLPAILAMQPERIVYVSCDPATFSRDAALLTEQGYALCVLQAFDMFPQTMHVETLALFERQ